MTQSSLVKLLQITDPCGRYAEHKELLAAFEQEVFYYQGTEFIAWAEDRLVEEMQELSGLSSSGNACYQRTDGKHDNFQCPR